MGDLSATIPADFAEGGPCVRDVLRALQGGRTLVRWWACATGIALCELGAASGWVCISARSGSGGSPTARGRLGFWVVGMVRIHRTMIGLTAAGAWGRQRPNGTIEGGHLAEAQPGCREYRAGRIDSSRPAVVPSHSLTHGSPTFIAMCVALPGEWRVVDLFRPSSRRPQRQIERSDGTGGSTSRALPLRSRELIAGIIVAAVADELTSITTAQHVTRPRRGVIGAAVGPIAGQPGLQEDRYGAFPLFAMFVSRAGACSRSSPD